SRCRVLASGASRARARRTRTWAPRPDRACAAILRAVRRGPASPRTIAGAVRLRRDACTAALAIAAAVAASGTARAAGSCTGQISATPKPGPALRFGITPGVQTGQLGTGPVPPRTPEDPSHQLAA